MAKSKENKRGKGRKWLIIIAVILILGGIGSLRNKQTADSSPQNASATAAPTATSASAAAADTATPSVSSAPTTAPTEAPTPEPTATPTPTPAPTPTPTAAPTQTPTPELTATPEPHVVSFDGDTGYYADPDGSLNIESLFDEAIIQIKSNVPHIADAAITVDFTNKRISAVVIIDPPQTINETHDIGDSIIRLISSTLAWSDKYQGPSFTNFGSLFDEFEFILGIMEDGQMNYTAAAARGTHRLTWSKK